ncbi:MAG: glycosyltransferase family 4 protein [candidate division Zixibacteria bacterium]|nr:glycosyltransferase family 4 protein [candidate division Zixibacteria bacterium]
MRIGYVVKMFPRLSETFVLNEILELERQGVDVVVFSLKKPNEGRFHPGVTRVKAPVIYLEDLEPKKWWSWLSVEWTAFAPHAQGLWSILERELPTANAMRIDEIFYGAFIAAKAARMDIRSLHAHFASIPATLAFYASATSGIPYSFTAHAKDIYTDSVDQTLLEKKLAAAQFVITVTDFNRRYLAAKFPNIPSERIRVLHNGVDLDFFSPGESTSPSGNSILGVGRLVPKKGFEYLLRACSILRNRGVGLRCQIVGQGPGEPALRELSKELGLEADVEFLGARNQEEVRALMRSATVTCLPCLRDGDGNQDALPTVLLEALGCGLPVVSTRLSGIPEIIDSEENGLLVEPGEPDELALALGRVLESESLRQRYAILGRKKAEEKFDLRRNVGTLRQMFAGTKGPSGRPDFEISSPAPSFVTTAGGHS